MYCTLSIYMVVWRYWPGQIFENFHYVAKTTYQQYNRHVKCKRGHSRLGYYFWDKGLKDYVAVDLGIYHDLLLFDQ